MSVIKPQSTSHWYDREGNPRYDIEKVKGGKRKTNIKDARKFGWFPSVTSILKIVDKPFLAAWIGNQGISACLKVSQMKKELTGDGTLTDADLPAIKKHSDEVSKEARDKGTAYHRAIERIVRELSEGKIKHDPGPLPKLTYEAFMDVYRNYGMRAQFLEHSFANLRYGFGGRLDWAGLSKIRDMSVPRFSITDYKTQNTKGKGEFNIYEEVPCQLAAYGYGIGKPAADLGTIFIDTSIEGNVKMVYHPDNDDYFYAFLEAFRVWKGPLGKKYEV